MSTCILRRLSFIESSSIWFRIEKNTNLLGLDFSFLAIDLCRKYIVNNCACNQIWIKTNAELLLPIFEKKTDRKRVKYILEEKFYYMWIIMSKSLICWIYAKISKFVNNWIISLPKNLVSICKIILMNIKIKTNYSSRHTFICFHIWNVNRFVCLIEIKCCSQST